MRMLSSTQKPAMKLWSGFASPDECAALIELARPRLTRSTVLDRASGHSVVMDARTSRGAMFAADEFPLLRDITDRAAALLAVPRENIEPLQVIRYGVGDRYEPHNDWFDPSDPGSAGALRQGGQRIKTLLAYLNTPADGGETVFPEGGATVAAVAGHAVQFDYPTGSPADLCLHGGAPVAAGEKWAVNVWARRYAYGTAPAAIARPWIFNADDCAQLRAIYDANAYRCEGPTDHVVRVRPEDHMHHFIARVKEYVDAAFPEPKVVETVVLARIPAGVEMNVHADNVRWTGNGYQPNHTPERTHTCVTFLNDGDGATVFGENPHGQGDVVEIAQREGHAHIHRCGPDFHHRVKAPSQARYSFTVWFKAQ